MSGGTAAPHGHGQRQKRLARLLLLSVMRFREPETKASGGRWISVDKMLAPFRETVKI
jgi:hypothetical protein